MTTMLDAPVANRYAPAGSHRLLLAGTERFLVEFVRAKDDRFLWGFSTAQAVAMAAVPAGITLLVLRSRREPSVLAPAVEPAGRAWSLRPQGGGSKR